MSSTESWSVSTDAQTESANRTTDLAADSQSTVQSSEARIPVEIFDGTNELAEADVVDADDTESKPRRGKLKRPQPMSAVSVSENVSDIVSDSVSESIDSNFENCAESPSLDQEVDQEEDELVYESSAFEELGLNPQLVAAIERAGYLAPTPIQAATIPHVLSGVDLIGQAETGSGKTAAFACPLLSQIDLSIKSPQVLVLTPTRELAIQVTAAFEKYGAECAGFKALSIYGGQSYETQLNGLRRGVQVIVGTPGRVMDHLRQGTLDLSALKTFVLDEADEMLRMGFIDDVEWILEQLPAKRQILLFSATMPEPIQRIAEVHLNQPVNISIRTETATAETIQQSCLFLSSREKLDALAQILDSEPTEGVIVFVKTRNTTVLVADQLSVRGFSAAPLNGEIPQNQRERTISQLKSGRLNVLVATDVAARGLDVKRISHVINYDFPHDTEAYIHRIGRTGRAGREGAAILFVEPKEKGKLSRLQRDTNQRIATFKQKTLAELNAQRVDRFKQQIGDALENETQLKFFQELVAEYQQQTEQSLEKIAAALAVMAQGEIPLLLTAAVKPQPHRRNDSESSSRHDRTGRKPFRSNSEMTTYRIEVGRNHGVGPGNIVGAIANEANLDNSLIGRIKLFDSFSLIDLDASLGADVIDALQDVTVSGQPLRITADRAPRDRRESPRRKRNDGSTKFSKRYSGSGEGQREPRFSKRESHPRSDASRDSSESPRRRKTRDDNFSSALRGESRPRRDRDAKFQSKSPSKGFRDTSRREKTSDDQKAFKASRRGGKVAAKRPSSDGAMAAMGKRKSAVSKFVKIRDSK